MSLIPNDIPDGYYNEDGTNVGSSTEGAISDTFRRAGTFFGRSGGNSGYGDDQNGVSIQLVRSCTEWSNGVATEVILSSKNLCGRILIWIALNCECLH